MARPTSKHEKLRRLCVAATCILEDLHDPVMRGQAASVTALQYRGIARRLRSTGKKLVATARALECELKMTDRKQIEKR